MNLGSQGQPAATLENRDSPGMQSFWSMPRRLLVENRVVGDVERDDPDRVLRGSALTGGRGRIDLGALHGSADGVVVEPAVASPVLEHFGEHDAYHPDGRLPAKECLHRAAAALDSAVGALLQVRAKGGEVKGKT